MESACTVAGTELFDIPPANDVLATVALLGKGLPVACFEALSQAMDINEKDLAGLVRISPSTIGRRKKAGSFPPEEGERVLRLMRVAQRAAELFGRKDRAIRWLKHPNAACDGRSPLEFLETEPGAAHVLRLIGRLEHGVFS